MQDCGIKIKIEKNNYQNGALDFWMFNPEKNDYDEKNAFSDENRLLRFTSDTRKLEAFVEEMVQTLLETYGHILRQNSLQIDFYGNNADAELLQSAINRTADAKQHISFIAHNKTDPVLFMRSICDILTKFNAALERVASDEITIEMCAITPICFTPAAVQLPSTDDNEQSVLSAAQTALKALKEQSKNIESVSEQVKKAIRDTDSNKSSHVMQKAELQNELCELFRTSLLPEKSRLAKAYFAALDKLMNYYAENYKSSDWKSCEWNAEQMSEFSFGFLERLNESLHEVIDQTLHDIFSAAWQKNASAAENKLRQLYECDVCELKQVVAFDTRKIWNMNPLPQGKDYVFEGRKPSKKMSPAVEYNGKTKLYCVHYRKYAELFNKESAFY